ncbi:unnamed protein product [Acanthosepion pharaonis]|uniref:Uncharacterized protein n=1 Tax=Acanthosepion pharaonis TaxID=158019 RepID=A0A812BXL9_ACAPH|nr:unnamed protein product [Sepia pharaonis]
MLSLILWPAQRLSKAASAILKICGLQGISFVNGETATEVQYLIPKPRYAVTLRHRCHICFLFFFHRLFSTFLILSRQHFICTFINSLNSHSFLLLFIVLFLLYLFIYFWFTCIFYLRHLFFNSLCYFSPLLSLTLTFLVFFFFLLLINQFFLSFLFLYVQHAWFLFCCLFYSLLFILRFFFFILKPYTLYRFSLIIMSFFFPFVSPSFFLSFACFLSYFSL